MQAFFGRTVLSSPSSMAKKLVGIDLSPQVLLSIEELVAMHVAKMTKITIDLNAMRRERRLGKTPKSPLFKIGRLVKRLSC